MNIESQTLNRTTKNSQQAVMTAGPNASKPNGTNSFKSELESIDNQEKKAEQAMSTSISQNTSQSSDTKCFKNVVPKNSNSGQSSDSKSFKDELNSVGAIAQSPEGDESSAATAETNSQVNKKSQTSSSKSKNKTESQIKSDSSTTVDLNNVNGGLVNKSLDLFAPLSELSSEIATINNLKRGALNTKSSDLERIDASIDYKVIKMETNDALFFANLVNSNSLNALNSGATAGDFIEMKSDASLSSSKVSSVLMDALSDAMTTNKPFRIDFDKDIAVILKVDRDGKVSAEFIPGDKAVEQYLKNNIPLLKESFDKQNLAYNDLSYQKQKQQQQQQNNDNREKKENDDE